MTPGYNNNTSAHSDLLGLELESSASHSSSCEWLVFSILPQEVVAESQILAPVSCAPFYPCQVSQTL